jgi:hypothetical protein
MKSFLHKVAVYGSFPTFLVIACITLQCFSDLALIVGFLLTISITFAAALALASSPRLLVFLNPQNSQNSQNSDKDLPPWRGKTILTTFLLYLLLFTATQCLLFAVFFSLNTNSL